MKITVAVNERGQRVGDSHPRAKLTNREVDLLLQLREEEGWSYNQLADKFEISKSGVRRICNGTARCQCVVRFKVVEVDIV